MTVAGNRRAKTSAQRLALAALLLANLACGCAVADASPEFEDSPSAQGFPYADAPAASVDISPEIEDSQSVASAPNTDAPASPEQGPAGAKRLEELLPGVDWQSAGTPFLQGNARGNYIKLGMGDINRDGQPEFLLAVSHPPRGVPSVEAFTLQDGALRSIGGFFEDPTTENRLDFYEDRQGRLLFLQETTASYGGTMQTLVATYVEGLHSVPIAAVYSHYGAEGTETYFGFPQAEPLACTNAFLTGEYPADNGERYIVSEEAYHRICREFRDTLTPAGETAYAYSAHCELEQDLFLTPDEIQRGDHVVADILREADFYAMDVHVFGLAQSN